MSQQQAAVTTPDIQTGQEPVAAPPQQPANSLTSTDGGSGGPSLTDNPGVAPATPQPGVIVDTQPQVTPDAPVDTAWKTSLPDELKNDPSMQHINDVGALAKSYVHAQKQFGMDKIAVPGKNASDEDWQMVYHKLGLPSDLKSYEITMPEEVAFNEDVGNAIKEEAFKAGVLPEQLNKVLAGYSSAWREAQLQATKQAEQDADAADQKLRQEWGAAYESNFAVAKSAVGYLNDPAFNSWLEETGMQSNPLVIKVMNKFGQLLKEDTIHQMKDNHGAQAPKQAQDEINTVMGDKKHAYHNPEHANHKSAVQDMLRLHELVNPDVQSNGIPTY